MMTIPHIPIKPSTNIAAGEAGTTAGFHGALDISPEAAVHQIVNDRVNHGGAHGQEVEGQEERLDPRLEHDRFIKVDVDKVAVVWQPANGEREDHHDKHPYDLEKICKKIKLQFCNFIFKRKNTYTSYKGKVGQFVQIFSSSFCTTTWFSNITGDLTRIYWLRIDFTQWFYK